MAAAALVLNIFPQGSHIIAMKGVYGGTFRLFERVAKENCGHEFDYVDLNDLAAVRSKIKDNTRMIWIESPTNPLLELVDIEAICGLAREHNIVTCIDNTFATPWNQKPLTMGADLIMVSSSKYIGGHSDLIGGAVITNRDDLAERLNFLKTTTGAIASPFDAYLALRGLKTRHCGWRHNAAMHRPWRNFCPVTTRLKSILSGPERSPSVRIMQNRCAPAVLWSLFS